MKLKYVTCDVFTDQRFGGNPLAVVYEADGLDTVQMQRIAAEFNYSETTFVLPPKDSANTAQVRIFTPASELPFAGHPNVGTAVAMGKLGLLGDANEVRFEEKAGLVVVALERDGADIVGATLTAPIAPEFAGDVEAADVAKALGLPSSAIVTTRHKPRLASTGVYFLMIEIDSLENLARAQIPAKAGAAEMSREGFFIYTRDGSSADYRARMFTPQNGIAEDPATGGACAGWTGLMASLQDGDGDYAWTIDQGVEMGRPSRINVTAKKQGGKVTKVTVGGGAVLMMEGVLTI